MNNWNEALGDMFANNGAQTDASDCESAHILVQAKYRSIQIKDKYSI